MASVDDAAVGAQHGDKRKAFGEPSTGRARTRRPLRQVGDTQMQFSLMHGGSYWLEWFAKGSSTGAAPYIASCEHIWAINWGG
jgi:hypothetical protein